MSKDNEEKPFSDLYGRKEPLAFFLDKKVIITNFHREKSKKPEGKDYYAFQLLIPVIKNGEKKVEAMRSWNGSIDVRYFFQRVEQGKLTLPIKTRVMKEENSYYFEGYRDYLKDMTNNTLTTMDIDFGDDDYNVDIEE